MNKAMVISFNLCSDMQQLMDAYSKQLSYIEFMLEKLNSNSYKSDNSKEIREYSLEKDALEFALKKLKEIDN